MPVVAEIVIVSLFKVLLIEHSITADSILAVAVLGSEQVAVGDDGEVKDGVIVIAEVVSPVSIPVTVNVYVSLVQVPATISEAVKVSSE